MGHLLIRIGAFTNEIMVCVVINGNKLPHSQELVEQLLQIDGMTSICLNVNKEKSNVILGKEIINMYGKDYIEEITLVMLNLEFHHCPFSR